MADVAAKIVKLAELRPDPKNANRGTERGFAMLDASLREDGAGRGILLDKDGVVIAGNKTLERAADLGFDEVIVVPTDGRQLVATQRMDVDLDTEQGRRMAYRDNRIGEVDLAWDAEQLLADVGEGLDLSGLWSDGELKELLADVQGESADAEPQIDRAAALLEKWQVKQGDLFGLGKFARCPKCGKVHNLE